MAADMDSDDIKLELNGVQEKLEKSKKVSRPQSAHSPSAAGKISPGSNNSSENLQLYRSLVTKEKWKELKKMTETAVKDKKIFLIKGGGWPAIRRALLARGWIQKFESPKSYLNSINPQANDVSTQDGAQKNPADNDKISKLKCEKLIMHKLLENQPIDFLWTTKRDRNDWLLVKTDVIISRFCRANFTSKEGLCSSINQMHWYTEPGVSYTCFPRCYNLHIQEQMEEFVDDFRLTACIGLLKWLVNTFQLTGEEGIIIPNGRIPISALEFALTRLSEYLTYVTHRDIDDFDDISKHVWEYEWDHFLTHHYLVVHENDRFNSEHPVSIDEYEERASKLLRSLRKYWPQIDLDGMMNIWIVKPGNKCRGRGIQLMNNIKDIVGVVNLPQAAKTRFVVQKYIENPLVIYNTKFDIRQWFLITCSQPLTIWMYKESYLRFSSQLFNLNNYHESVHLTNNAVQSRYKNNNERDKALPDENMWDCHTFKTYLRQIDKTGMWEERIYPGMRECLVGAMLACQDSLDRRPNSFELYGADFMLTDDFTPWLIEINSSPDLAPTTSVTARMCPQCLEDIIKVVIDTRSDPEADTGLFELVYKQVIPKAPAYLGLTLSVNGKKIMKKKKIEKPKLEREYTTISSKLKNDTIPEDNIQQNYPGFMITDFIAWLKPGSSENNNNNQIQKEPEVEKNPEVPKDAENNDQKEKEVVESTVEGALKIIKSDLSLKSVKAKRKSKTHSKRDRCRSAKMKFPENCYKGENEPFTLSKDSNKDTKKLSSIEKCYWSDPKQIKSVGNKRCYIEPTTWERDTASILRACSTANLNPNDSRQELKHFLQITPRIFSPGIISLKKIYPKFKKKSEGSNSIEYDVKDGIGLNIKRVKHCKRQHVKKEKNHSAL